MSNINAYILVSYFANQGISSCIQILLEDLGSNTPKHYRLSRWGQVKTVPYNSIIDRFDAIYTFQLDSKINNEDITTESIIKDWENYCRRNKASILSNNCAEATQYFLNKYAHIPEPNISNISFDHLIFGIMWPSFIPFPVRIPGRVNSNARFYLEARKNPDYFLKYSNPFLYTSMSLALLTFAGSVFAFTLVATIFTKEHELLAKVGCIGVSLASSYGFFKSYNLLSAKNLVQSSQNKAGLTQNPEVKADLVFNEGV